jgi:hypothetical protein
VVSLVNGGSARVSNSISSITPPTENYQFAALLAGKDTEITEGGGAHGGGIKDKEPRAYFYFFMKDRMVSFRDPSGKSKTVGFSRG